MSAGAIIVRITATVEREFRRRGVFPMLRLENAARIEAGSTGVYEVSVARAKELVADAVVMKQTAVPAGIKNAYIAVLRNVKPALEAIADCGDVDSGASTIVVSDEQPLPHSARDDPATLSRADLDAVNEFLARRRCVRVLSAMGMLHRRKLPAGWRVIEGQRPA